ncbi:branched-chain amino acid ABC transporter permease [Catellatospora sp. TT07R-123]|uniref:branched-chain amino acid ABC transporter permease n=1 Tax=Catellatospora sp. TT07R-123 TaxID=2733863 RepID=UPI001BB3EAC8|nr:branched-chain amino acid ABC transporter permease [Catellatospora sp. TT07R-123]
MRRWWPLGLAVLLALLPYGQAFNAPGTLNLLALCLVFAGLAAGYDLLFGRTGLLSFGHALYFAIGAYLTVILMNHGFALPVAALLAMVAGTAVAALLGAVALRVDGIAFSMVTLAFAQVGAIIVARDPGGLTGGEEGATIAQGMPDALVGVVNTVNLYWLALAYLVVVLVVLHRVGRSPAGRVLSAIRDDARRVGVLGLSPYRYKLMSFVLAGALAALGGTVYVLVVGGAAPHLSSSDLTLTLLVMVVLGGPGSRFGPALGGALFTFLDYQLTDYATDLPGPLAQPMFVLGVVFILAVYFFPGGLARIGVTLPGWLRRPARQEA